MNYCIYVIINNINNKIYVGQTNNFEKRYSKYKSMNTKRKLNGRENRPINLAIQKYGWINFEMFQIQYCNSRDELNIVEPYWIDFFNSTNNNIGYNLEKGGFAAPPIKSGTKSPVAKFSDQQIKDIRYKFSNLLLNSAELAKEYLVSESVMYKITRNITYFDPQYNLSDLFWKQYKDKMNITIRENLLFYAKNICGDKKAKSKFSYAQVKEIRRLYSEEKVSITEMARLHNVDYTTIDDIVKNLKYIDLSYLYIKIKQDHIQNSKKINFDQIKEIRKEYNQQHLSADKFAKSISLKYKVYYKTISNIIRNKTFYDS